MSEGHHRPFLMSRGKADLTPTSPKKAGRMPAPQDEAGEAPTPQDQAGEAPAPLSHTAGEGWRVTGRFRPTMRYMP